MHSQNYPRPGTNSCREIFTRLSEIREGAREAREAVYRANNPPLAPQSQKNFFFNRRGQYLSASYNLTDLIRPDPMTAQSLRQQQIRQQEIYRFCANYHNLYEDYYQSATDSLSLVFNELLNSSKQRRIDNQLQTNPSNEGFAFLLDRQSDF